MNCYLKCSNKKQGYETAQKKICPIPEMSVSSKTTQEIQLLLAGGSAANKKNNNTNYLFNALKCIKNYDYIKKHATTCRHIIRIICRSFFRR